MLGQQAKAWQHNERMMDSKRNLQIKLQHMFVDDERYQLQANEANYIHLKA